MQLSYRDQSLLLEDSWCELFVLTVAQWGLNLDECSNSYCKNKFQEIFE